MTPGLRRASAALLATALTACAEAPPLVAALRYAPAAAMPDEAFRAAAPEASSVALPTLAPFGVTALPNGLRVAVLERRSLPVVAVRLVLERGSADLGTPLDGWGILARLLADGSARRTWQELDAAWAPLAAGRISGFGYDGGQLGAKVRTGDLDAAVALLAETATEPRLLPAALSSARTKWLQDFANGRDDLGLAVARNLGALLFGPKHPYGFARPAAAGTNAIELEHERSLYGALFRPAHFTLVFVGDVTPEAARASAARWFGGWRGDGPAFARPPLPEAPAQAARVTIVPWANREQVRVLLAARLPSLGLDELAAAEVLARSLGGLSSNLRNDVRDVQGAAYTFSAQVATLRGASWLELGGPIERGQVVGTLRTVLSAVRSARTKGLPVDAVERARASLLGEWRARAATIDGVAGLAASALARGLPLTSVAAYPARLAAVTPEQVRAVAARCLADDALRAVIVGDNTALAGLEQLGLGRVEYRDGFAQPVTR